MKPIGLGEHGEVSIVREGGGYVAYVRYRDFRGRLRRLKRSGGTKAAASRAILRAVTEALGQEADEEFTARSEFADAARAWLTVFEGLVERGTRSPSTLDEYHHVIRRVIEPGIGALRLGEITTPRLDRFVQAVLAERGMPRRSCAVRCCRGSAVGWSGVGRWRSIRCGS